MQSKLKFRNVYPEIHKEKYDQALPSTTSSDSCLIKGNPKYLSFAWKAGGGGSLAVLDLNKPQRLNPVIPLIKGHAAAIQDQDFNPFNDNMIATASDDTTVKVWDIPEEFTQDVTAPLMTLQGHGRKVNFLQFHPSTEQIIASASNDSTVKVWDLEKQADALTLTAPDANYWSLSWNTNGSLLGATSKDKLTRIGDPRAQQWVSETPTHEGSRAQKMAFLGDTGLMLTVGFAKSTDREFKVWDLKSLKEPVQSVKIDQQASVLFPFYDADVGMLYLAGRGDGNIRYYEFNDGTFTYTSDHKSTVPQKGIGFIPKRGVNVMKCELMRALKLTDNYIEFISFIQPRKASSFQDDLYPNCLSETPAQTTEAWLAGNNAAPLRRSMKPDESASQQKTVTKTNSTSQDNNEIERLQKALEEARHEIEKLNAEQAKSKDAENLKQQVENFRAEHGNLSKENAVLENKVVEMEAVLNDLHKKYDEQHQSSNTKENFEAILKIQVLRSQLADLESYVENLQAKLQLKHSQLEALHHENEHLKNLQESLQGKLQGAA